MNTPITNLIARVVDAASRAETEYQVTLNVSHVLTPALAAFDTLLAWASGDLSEGRACELLKVNRETLRKMRLEAVGRVTGDMNAPAIADKRAKAIERMDAWVGEYAADRCSVNGAEAVLTFWKRARENPDFLQRLEDWRALCPPAVALFSSEGGKA